MSQVCKYTFNYAKLIYLMIFFLFSERKELLNDFIFLLLPHADMCLYSVTVVLYFSLLIA